MKPTTNARYRVHEVRASDRQTFWIYEGEYLFGILHESYLHKGGWRWHLHNDETVKCEAPTAQAALDALVAAYEQTLATDTAGASGNGEAGE